MTPFGASQLRILLLGPPASGKGTQGRRLAKALKLGYLSTGALLREQVENQTDVGQLAEPILARGEYLPDDLMCRIITEWLDHQKAGWVLDGFPRSLPQAEFLEESLKARGMLIDKAILLEVPFAELLNRIQCRVECPQCRWSGQRSQALPDECCPVCETSLVSRPDDNEANFTNRYQEFVRLTHPLVAYYRESGRLLAVDANSPQDEVAGNLLRNFLPCHSPSA